VVRLCSIPLGLLIRFM